MKLVFDQKWFNELPKKSLIEWVGNAEKKYYSKIMNENYIGQSREDYMYSSAVLSAEVLVIALIKYLLVDVRNVKPWLVKKPIRSTVGMVDFKQHVEDILNILLKRPPALNYTVLVQHQALVRILKTMEIKTNGR